MFKFIITIITILWVNVGLAGWAGSGFFIAKDGYIATAAHVVGDIDKQQVASQLEVLYQNREYFALVVAVDWKHDVAIIKIAADNSFYFNLNTVHYYGQSVYAIGHPLSAIDTRVSEGVIKDSDADSIYSRIYTCHGNSGGVLVNTSNEAIGITVAARTLGSDTFCSYASISSNIVYVKKLASSVGLNLINQPSDGAIYSRAQLTKFVNKNNSVVLIYGNL